MQATLRHFGMADDAGFDWVTVAEHHFSPFSITPNPMVMAGAMSQVVKKAKIALLGPDIPILNPVRVAEEIAMLDTMTGGRVVAGMMRGTPNEYVTYNINPSESRERFAEALELIKMAWTQQEPFGWQGRFYEFRSICIWPRPIQKPHPPLYMSGSSPEAGAYAAKNHIGIGFAFTNLPRSIKAAQYYREHAQKCGWDPTPDDIIYRVAVHLADSDSEAREDVQVAGAGRTRVGVSTANKELEAAVAKSGFYGADIEGQRGRLMDRSELEQRIENGQILIGSPDTVVKQIKRIHDELGAGVLDLTLIVQTDDKPLRTIELLGEKVLPYIREF